MKRIITAIVAALMIIGNLVCFEAFAASKVPTKDDMGGYDNVCLTYTFRRSGSDMGRHYESDLLPYTAYLDKNGKAVDFFFDSYLFLPCMDYGPSGARMHLDESNPTKAIDWTSYVDDTFHKGANVDALEKAFGTTKTALNDKNRKAGVFFTLLYPGKKATNFGTLGGKSLNFSKMEDRKYAIKWMIDEQMARFEKGGYKNLELVGFYWLEEYIAASDDAELLKYASDYLHSKGLKFIWIPWYKANGYDRWQSYGFDVACMQPNLMWLGYHDPTRVGTSCQLSEKYGLSMEMECDGRVNTDEYFDRYLDYLEGGLNSSMMDSIKMYYQDGKTAVYYRACYSKEARYRMVYDLTYKYAKGTLTQADIDKVRPAKVETGYEYVSDIGLNSLMSNDVDWISVGKKYSGCRSYTDGNGLGYQQVDGKELTDGILANKILTTDWHAFHHSLLDRDGKMSVVIDLGETRNDLTHFYAHFDNRMDYGIGTPTGITLSISTNGSSFKQLATPTLYADSSNSCIKYVTTPVSARYVKLSFNPAGGNFVFCSEFLVGVKKDNYVEESTPDESNPEVSAPDESSKPEESKNEESIPVTESDTVSDTLSNGESGTPDEDGSTVSDATSSDCSAEPTVSEPTEQSIEEQSTQSPTDPEQDQFPWIWIVIGVIVIIVIAVTVIFIRKK